MTRDDDGPPGGWVTKRDTLPSGVVRVTHVPPADPAPTWTLVEELRVGTLDGGGPDSFGRLGGLVALEGGGFAVLESQAAEIRVFAADGSHVATHGGRGEGPGEFRDPTGLMIDPDGRLVVPDPANGLMSVFEPVEGFIESFRFIVMMHGAIWEGVMTADGRIFRESVTSDFRGRELRVFDRSMNRVDSIPLPGAPFSRGGGSGGSLRVKLAGGVTEDWALPFHPRERKRLGPDGAFWATEAGDPSYRLRKWRPRSSPEFEVVMERPPVPVTPAERDSVKERVRKRIRERGGGSDPNWSKIPEFKPPVSELFFSVEGDLWVRVPSAGAGIAYDVFGPEGAYLGTLTAASGLKSPVWLPPVVVGDSFWVVVSGDLGVPYVVRARIAPADG